jgi:hypothetical protein
MIPAELPRLRFPMIPPFFNVKFSASILISPVPPPNWEVEKDAIAPPSRFRLAVGASMTI